VIRLPRLLCRTVERNPHLLNSAFWTASSFRAEHLAEIIETARRRPTDLQSRLLLAIELAKAQNDTTAAENFVRQLVAAFPDSLEAQQWQAKTLLGQKKFQESWNLANQIQDFQLLGEIARARGDISTARINFQKEMFIRSDNPEPRFQLAQLALAEGKTEEAISYLKSTTLPYHRPDTTDSRFIYGHPTYFLCMTLSSSLLSLRCRGSPTISSPNSTGKQGRVIWRKPWSKL
jgi:tetratricopeptide (TPR) repeat protein